MHVAQQRHHSGGVELEVADLPLGPRAHIVSQLFVPTDSRPEDVVLNIVTVQELHGRTDRCHQDVRLKEQRFLVHGKRLVRLGKGFACYGFYPHHRNALSGCDSACNVAGVGSHGP